MYNFLCSIYDEDLILANKLGLKPFYNLNVYEEFFMGRVSVYEGSWVEIWVTCAPAKSFRARIYCKNHEENGCYYNVNTGSGTLSEYWPMFKALAEPMIVVEMIKINKE